MAADKDVLIYEKKDYIATVMLNRPESRNALSVELVTRLHEVWNTVDDDPEVRVIILRGAGEKAFVAGADISQFKEKRTGEVAVREYNAASDKAGEALRECTKPTIAMIQGYCIMGGLMLASCCDLIVAAEDAVFADRSVRWGGAHVQYFSMPWDLGPRKAKEYLFTGDYVDAQAALRLGLVNRVVPRAALAPETLKLAQRIALQDPFALKLAKASVNETLDIQGQRRAIEAAFKNYMLTIPHRQLLGTYGAEARAKSVKERIQTRDRKFGDAAGE